MTTKTKKRIAAATAPVPIPPVDELEALVTGLNPRAVLPRGFGLWSDKLQHMWLSQHQRKARAKT